MSLMWIPALITRAPFALARSAAGISAPTGAKTIAPSSSSGGASPDEPTHSAPSSRANACVSSSPSRVKANTRRPSWTATWQRMWAEAPKP